MDPNQNNNADGSQGPFPGWNPYMFSFQCPPNWIRPGYQQVPINNQTGNVAQVIQLGETALPSNPNDEEHDDSMAVPSPTAANTKKTKAAGRPKLGNFNPEEDVNIVRSWLEVSCDPVASNSQKRDTMWGRVMERYNLRRGNYLERTLRSIQSCCDIIKAEVAKFSAFYADTVRENPSGATDADMTTRAAANFASIQKRNFPFIHCWELMKNEPKWQDPKQREISKEALGSDFGEDNINVGGSNAGGSGGSRPMGRDSAKAAKKNANSSAGSASSSEYAARMQDLSLQRITTMQEESVRKNDRFQQLASIDEKRYEKMEQHNQSMLEVEQEKVRLMREKQEVDMQEREKLEDERILGIDLNACTAPQRVYYEALQEDILEKIAARRRKRQAP
ncbi:hypothetical protein ACP4OV_018371 [Aristida adscensionis]